MKLKHGVSIAGLNIEVKIAHAIATVIYKDNGQELVVTAGTEKVETHKEDSRHAYGDAIDTRIYYFLSERAKVVADEIRRQLGILSVHYSVILEDDHIHIQWNPDRVYNKSVDNSGEAPA